MTSGIAQTIVASVPIILLIALGALIRITRIISDAGLADIKRLVVNVALPTVFFASFLTIELDLAYLALFVLMPVVLFALLFLGYAIERPLGGQRTIPFLMTGFEFGMLGISLFGTAYGMDRVGVISIVGFPHELFIWFVYVTLLQARYGRRGSIGQTARSFATSPIIIAIVLGALLNVVGIGAVLTEALWFRPVLRAMELLGGIIGPLILIVIGYGMRISRRGVLDALPVVVIRFSVVLLIALLLVPWLVERVIGLPTIFTHAVVTFVILPPPFIIPLYVPGSEKRDLAYANNVLSVYTLFSIATFLVYFWFNPA